MNTQTILLVLDDRDLQDLPGAVEYLRRNRQNALWIIHGPQVGITNQEATQDVDQEIEKLNVAIQQAANREDFEAANRFKAQRDEHRIRREKVIRDGWKSVAPAQADKMRDAVFQAFDQTTAGVVYRSMLDENCPRQDAYRVVDIQLKHVAPDPFKGAYPFAVVFPGALRSKDAPAVKAPEATDKAKPVSMPEPDTADGYRVFLRGMKHYGFVNRCKQSGIAYTKGPKDAAIEELVAIRFPKKEAA